MNMRRENGFTLIELAIVMVIIGTIIMAMLKGRDLIETARLKKFESEVRSWRTSAWLYLERKGRFPGDGDDNGIIGDETTPVPGSAVIQNADLINPPKANPVVVGSLSFWIYWGYDGGGSGKRKQNVMVICASDDCESAYTDNSGTGNLEYVEFLDVVIDGVADGTDGYIRAVNTAPALFPVNGDDRAVTSVGAGADWTSGDSKALVYFIDDKI
jgi:prepilin-type N-terminal cleavage/methylation domain-containing protein